MLTNHMRCSSGIKCPRSVSFEGTDVSDIVDVVCNFSDACVRCGSSHAVSPATGLLVS